MVGKILSANRATFFQLGLTKKLNILGRFIHQDAKGMEQAFAKAEAKKAAREVVATADQQLFRTETVTSHDLRSLDWLMANARPAATPEQRNNPDFRVALFEAAWEKSAGKGKLRLLLKTNAGASRDGTRTLKFELRELAKAGNWDRLQTATKLAALLDAVKKCPTEAGNGAPSSLPEILENQSAILQELAGKLSPTFDRRMESARKGDDIAGLPDFIGEALTASLRPGSYHDWKFTLESANGLKTDKYGSKLDNPDLLRFAEYHFNLFSSEVFWKHPEVSQNLREYFSITLSMAALNKIKAKLENGIRITDQDVQIVLGTFRLDGPKGAISTTGLSDREIFRDLCRMTAAHYIWSDNINLMFSDREGLKTLVDQAKGPPEAFDAMAKTFEMVFKVTDFEKARLVKPIEEITNQLVPT